MPTPPYYLLAQASVIDIERIVWALVVLALAVIFWRPAIDTLDMLSARLKEKVEFDDKIWFDDDDSTLHRGSLHVLIPINTVEYFVCKLVFDTPKKYRDDIDVLDIAEVSTATLRTVEQAVRRVNEKARKSLGLKDNLLLRSKEKTILNKKYLA